MEILRNFRESNLNVQQPLKLISSVLLLIMPILNQYIICPIEFQGIFFVCAIFIYILFFGFEKFDKLLTFFILYAIAETIINTHALDIQISARIGLRLIYFLIKFYFIFALCKELIEPQFFYKCYKICVLIVSAALLVQYIAFAITKEHVTLLIPNAQLNYNNGINSLDVYALHNESIAMGSFRPSSFFIEPAYFAKYVIPCLGLSLAELDHNFKYKNLFFAVFATLSIFLTTSSMGIIVSLIMWFVFGVKKCIFSVRNRKRSIVIFVLAIAVSICFLLLIPPIANELMNKIASLKDLTRTTSLSIRLLRGPAVLKQFKVINLIFGCGYGNLESYIEKYTISTIYDSEVLIAGSVNGISAIIAYFGVIGFGIIIFYIIKNTLDIHRFDTVILFIPWILILCEAYYIDSPVYFIMLGTMLAVKSKGIVDFIHEN